MEKKQVMETALHKISPSTSVAKFSYVTPKRNFTPQRMMTPIHLTKEEKEKGTPLRRNPFDVKAESLYLPSCSPSVFAKFQRNKVDDGSFRWSIEHLSVLYPADIDETSVPETWVDADHEMKAQKAIDAFFSQNSIVPSPWSSSPKEGKSGLKSRRRARTNMFSIVQNCDATTQTMLSIPPDVDLKKILGNFFTFEDNEENNSSGENSREETDLLSTSSLRRKLFVNDEDRISPRRKETDHLNSAKRRNTPSVHMKSLQSTPSDLLSSSPITPPNCSDACNIFASPTLSPIAAAPVRDTQLRSFNVHDAMERANPSSEKLKRISSVDASWSIMSFCVESQETIQFPSYTSERQDTGYASGSISSSQNMTSEVHYGLISRITPVTELMEECELSSNSMSCDMSYRNDFRSMEELHSFECSKTAQSNTCNFKTYPWVPACCSTPAQCPHL